MSWEKFIALGRIDADNRDEEFSMSHLAAKLSQWINGVSKIHGQVSREMFQHLYEGFEAEELHIDYVTNSVHYPTWTAPDLQEALPQNVRQKLSCSSNRILTSGQKSSR